MLPERQPLRNTPGTLHFTAERKRESDLTESFNTNACFKTKIARAPKRNKDDRNTLCLHNNCVQYYDVHFERHSPLTWSVSLWLFYSQTTLPHLFYIQMMAIFTFQNLTFRDWKPAVINGFDLTWFIDCFTTNLDIVILIRCFPVYVVKYDYYKNIGSEMNFHFIQYLWNVLCV